MKQPLFRLAAVAGGTALLSACAASHSLSKADKRYAEGQFEQAIVLYKADVARGKNAAQANYRIGEAYRLSNRLELAEPFYKAALDGKVRQPEAGYRYAQALRATGKFGEAAAQFSQYAQSGTNRPLAERAAAEAKASQASLALTGQAAQYDVHPVDALNSPGSDFSATRLPGTGELVFASGRDGKTYAGNGTGYLALYAQRLDDPLLTATASAGPAAPAAAPLPAAPAAPTAAAALAGGGPRRLEALFNDAKTQQASATYTPDGKTMVFARSNDGSKKGYLSNDLWISYFRAGAWTAPELANVNDRTADDFAPAFAPDGTTLYFASNRKTGQGGTDLYRATLGSNGRFSGVENLGAAVNTPGDDSFPGVAPDGTLYFASNGQPGFGKLDLFKYQNGQVLNLGPGLNSPADDFAPFFTGPNQGVFSSNRAGGKGLDDLYAFAKKPRKVVAFEAQGTVLERDDKKNATTPVAGETVTLTSGSGQRQDVVTGPDGRFTARLDSAQAYTLVSDRAGDFTARASLSTVGRYPDPATLTEPRTTLAVPVTLTLNKIVMNKAIEIKDIFYDYNKAAIRPDAAVRLDTLAQTLRDNPAISIELSANTDQRGNDAYNLKLSQQRAEAAVAYLISKGIDRRRLTARGYGETRPIVKNAKTEADFQRNRRTEFKVTRIGQ